MTGLLLFLRECFFLIGCLKPEHRFPRPLSPKEEATLLAELANGSDEARQKLIEHNLRLVVHIAKKYAAGRDMEELISIGSLGLVKAVNTFDPTRGKHLSAYAARCIENEILMSIRAEKKTRNEISLSEPIGTDGEGNELALEDLLPADVEDVADAAISGIRLSAIRAALHLLTPREQTVLTLRYGLDGAPPLTQKETGDRLGLSRSYVSRIETKALKCLSAALRQ